MLRPTLRATLHPIPLPMLRPTLRATLHPTLRPIRQRMQPQTWLFRRFA
jgi:hypothetical protein